MRQETILIKFHIKRNAAELKQRMTTVSIFNNFYIALFI